ncbi:MAG: CAP domain-containing protein [Saprospiraceae bacterium]|nr:CAP domain-containing protein [Saprospiraceae bacterium]MBP7679781.1 CAP domain-containing protein [Saprospiraceae bacterium]
MNAIRIILTIVLLSALTAFQKKKPIEPYQKTGVMLINEIRTKGCRCGGKYYAPVSPLTWNDKLYVAAARHSADMYRMDDMNHVGSDGSESSDRISRAGYKWSYCGENIAWGFDNAESVVAAWKESTGHCRTLMSPTYTQVGFAKKGQYWTMDFAKPAK